MPKWDLASINSLNGAASWIRKGSGARLVLVIRPNDVVVSADPQLAPMDAINMIRNELPQLLDFLIKQRGKKSGANPDAEDP